MGSWGISGTFCVEYLRLLTCESIMSLNTRDDVVITQIQAVQHPGDSNCGPHTMLFALIDGTPYVRYFSSGHSNVPTDGKWRQIIMEFSSENE